MTKDPHHEDKTAPAVLSLATEARQPGGPITLATWNVNSLRARLERVSAWLREQSPDMVCLQETKCQDEVFPREAIEALGYHVAFQGQKTYNGVAILSKQPLREVRLGLEDGDDGSRDPQARLIAATSYGLRVICAYVPNGSEVDSDKWHYKLAWLGRLHAYLERHEDAATPLVLCGDFNIAPSDADVAKPELWSDSTLCHAQARAALETLLDWGLADGHRLQEAPEGIFSWWDYRQLAFPKNNGLRIDLILLSAALQARAEEVWVDREARKGQKPSDHAPVLVRLAAGGIASSPSL